MMSASKVMIFAIFALSASAALFDAECDNGQTCGQAGLGVGYCCATISNCDTDDDSYNGESWCVQANQAFGTTGVSTDDTSCTALCNTPTEAICTVSSDGGASECAVYGDKYCCMVVVSNGVAATTGTCNTQDNVNTAN